VRWRKCIQECLVGCKKQAIQEQQYSCGWWRLVWHGSRPCGLGSPKQTNEHTVQALGQGWTYHLKLVKLGQCDCLLGLKYLLNISRTYSTSGMTAKRQGMGGMLVGTLFCAEGSNALRRLAVASLKLTDRMAWAPWTTQQVLELNTFKNSMILLTASIVNTDGFAVIFR
jgi:hypothetical protein